MSSQTGVFFFDLRPVPSEIEQHCSARLAWPTRTPAESTLAPGLVLAHAATWIDDIAENEKQPHTSVLGNTITFDGRLDNRQDLLLGSATLARRTNRLRLGAVCV